MSGIAQKAGMGLAWALARWRGRLGPARRWLSQAPFAAAAAPSEDRRQVRVAAVQFPLRMFSSAREYAQECHLWASHAVEAGAQLVVFPELVGFMPLLGFLPGIEALSLEDQIGTGTDSDNPLVALVRVMASATFPVYHLVFRTLARRFQVHIAAGSALVTERDGTVRNAAFLFGPDGVELGRQPKGHLYGLEFAMGLTRADSIRVFDTPVGKLACPVCMDHTYFETARIAFLLGAEILIDSSADVIAEYNWRYQLRGVWGRVQEAPAYGIQAMMVGDALGMPFRGKSAVFGPVGLVGEDGVLACAESCDGGEIVAADLDLGSLRAYRRGWDAPPRYDWCARHLGRMWAQAEEERALRARR